MKAPFVNSELFTRILTSNVKPSLDNDDIVSSASVFQTENRACTIVKAFIGQTIAVYNGKRFKRIKIKPDMVGHKLGEFCLTKKLGKSIHNSEHNRKKIEKMRRKITQKKVRKTATVKPTKK